MKTIALLLLLASQSGLRSTTLCTGDNPLDCLPPPPICGDGIIHPTEACDDGNRVDNDGCSMDCKRSSVVAARYRFDRTGTLDLPPGMPAPTFDCRLDKWSGTGNLVCNGTSPVTFTPLGGPTAGVPTYWRLGGGGAPGAGVGFDGVDDSFSAAKTLSGTFLVCYRGSLSAILGANRTIVAEWGATTAEKGWYLEVNGANLASFGTSATAATFTPAASVGAQNVMCGAYVDGGGSAANTLLLNFNGTAASATTATDIVASTANLVIGYGGKYAGSMSAITVWDFVGNPWQPTVAEMAALMARMVRSQYASQGSLGEPLTVTRANPQSVVLNRPDGTPFVTNVPANQLAIGKKGAEIYGARTSRVLWNQRSSANNTVGGICGTSSTWIRRGAATCALSATPAPDGTLTAEDITVGTSGNDIYNQASGFTTGASLATTVWIQRISTSGSMVIASPVSGVFGTWSVDLAAIGSSWVRLAPGTTGVTVTNAFAASGTGVAGTHYTAASGTVSFRIWRPWQVEGAIAGPDAEVAGSALPVAATLATAESRLSSVNDWCITTVLSFSAAFNNSTPGIFWSGAASVDGYGLYSSGGRLYFTVYDASGGLRFVDAGVTPVGQTKTLTTCNATGILSVYSDSILVSGVQQGTGTGIASHSLLNIGNRVGQTIDGSIREIVTCNTSNPALCR